MKLIHCSDIHLDSPMDSRLPPEKARERSRELCRTFCSLIDYARENGVSGVLLCGDLFDSRQISHVTAARVLSVMGEAEKVQFFYLRGNHDESRRAFAGEALPKNLHLFDSTWQSYRMGSVVITGREPEGDGWKTMYDDLTLREEDTNIVLLHGQVSGTKGEEQICLSALRERPIRYLALGHLHGYRREKLSPWGDWCYSGCLEGRGFDECGEHGFVLLDIREGRVIPSFVPFASRRLHTVEADISGLASYPDILASCADACREIGQRDMVKLTLRGECSPEIPLSLPQLRENLEERFYFLAVEDRTAPACNELSLSRDVSLKSAFARRVMACEELTEEEKSRVFRFGLNALYGREVTL